MIDSGMAKAQLRKAAEEGAGDPDYDGLHQGRDGTALRHKTVLELLRPHMKPGYRLLDWGCGTALLLKSISDAGMPLPDRYIGVDFLAERGPAVHARLDEMKIDGYFVRAEKLDQYAALLADKPTVLACIGIMGYPGLHSLTRISRAMSGFRDAIEHGAVTVPTQMPEHLGEAEMARYASEDVQNYLRANSFRQTVIHTDTVVYW